MQAIPETQAHRLTPPSIVLGLPWVLIMCRKLPVGETVNLAGGMVGLGRGDCKVGSRLIRGMPYL